MTEIKKTKQKTHWLSMLGGDYLETDMNEFKTP